jgi:hypothetical protein
MEQAVVGNAIPRFLVIAIDWNFKIDLRSIVKVPAGFRQ